MKLQFTKDNFYKITTIIALAALIIGQSNYFVKAQDKENVSTNEIAAEQQESTQALSPNLPDIPNATCLTNFMHWEGGSDTYNPNAEYSTLFMNSEGGTYQDINGDGLADYVYTDITYGGFGGSVLNNAGCVYLNNGSGWTKVYVCESKTSINTTTGEVIEQNYKGDCAGEPSSAKQEN